MKQKIMVALATALFTTASTQAQHFRIGPEAGLVMSNVSIKQGAKEVAKDPRLGFMAGGAADIGFNRIVSLHTGLYFIQKGYTLNSAETISLGGLSYRHTEKFDTRISYLQLPLSFQLNFGSPDIAQVFVGAGGYLGMALGGRLLYDYESKLEGGSGALEDSRSTDHALKIGNKADEHDVRAFDGGIMANAGIRFPFGLFVRGQAGIGMANIVPEGTSSNSARNWHVGLSAGFLFGK